MRRLRHRSVKIELEMNKLLNQAMAGGNLYEIGMSTVIQLSNLVRMVIKMVFETKEALKAQTTIVVEDEQANVARRLVVANKEDTKILLEGIGAWDDDLMVKNNLSFDCTSDVVDFLAPFGS